MSLSRPQSLLSDILPRLRSPGQSLMQQDLPPQRKMQDTASKKLRHSAAIHAQLRHEGKTACLPTSLKLVSARKRYKEKQRRKNGSPSHPSLVSIGMAGPTPLASSGALVGTSSASADWFGAWLCSCAVEAPRPRPRPLPRPRPRPLPPLARPLGLVPSPGGASPSGAGSVVDAISGVPVKASREP